jgi:hypothetical protein
MPAPARYYTPGTNVEHNLHEVNQITITIDPEAWETMQANMTELDEPTYYERYLDYLEEAGN